MSADGKKEEEERAGMTSEWRPSAVYKVRTPRVDDDWYLVESCCRLNPIRWYWVDDQSWYLLHLNVDSS
jgi:hypothetical protein